MQNNVIIDDKLLEKMEFITTIFSPVYENIGILIMGENFNKNSSFVIIRFFLLEKENNNYLVKKELQAFSMASFEQAILFLERLPKMSALELILYMGRDFK